MNQLHSSYTNLQSWKIESDFNKKLISIKFDQRNPICTTTLICALCWTTSLLIKIYMENENSNIIATAVFLVGLFYLIFVFVWIWLEKKKAI